MAKSKKKKLPKFDSLEKLVEFFETHDMSPYEESMPVVHFDFPTKRSSVLAKIDPKLSEEVSTIAPSKGISSRRLLNSYIRKGIRQERQAA